MKTRLEGGRGGCYCIVSPKTCDEGRIDCHFTLRDDARFISMW